MGGAQGAAGQIVDLRQGSRDEHQATETATGPRADKGRGLKGRRPMHAALAVAFGSIVVAPFIGKWRANVWLAAHQRREAQARSVRPRPNNVIEIA